MSERASDYYKEIILVQSEILISKIVKQVIRQLMKLKQECILSGDVSILENVWDEYCVQIQDQESVHFSAYIDAIVINIKSYIENLKDVEKAIIWLSTERGAEWIENLPEIDISKEKYTLARIDQIPVFDGDLISAVLNELDGIAINYSNKRIREYLSH